jgi:hypothetical protein
MLLHLQAPPPSLPQLSRIPILAGSSAPKSYGMALEISVCIYGINPKAVMIS